VLQEDDDVIMEPDPLVLTPPASPPRGPDLNPTILHGYFPHLSTNLVSPNRRRIVDDGQIDDVIYRYTYRYETRNYPNYLMIEEKYESEDADGMEARRILSFISFIASRRIQTLLVGIPHIVHPSIIINCLEADGITPRHFNSGNLPPNCYEGINHLQKFINLNNYLDQWFEDVRDQMTVNLISDANSFFTANDTNFIDFSIAVYRQAGVGCNIKRHQRIDKLIKQGFATAVETDGNCIAKAIELSTGLTCEREDVNDIGECAKMVESHIMVYTLIAPTYTTIGLVKTFNESKLIPTFLIEMGGHVDILIEKNKSLPALNMEFCESCKNWKTPTHCSICQRCQCGRSFTNIAQHKLSCRLGKQGLTVGPRKYNTPDDLTNMVHFCDLETFVEQGQMHVAYMACIKSITENNVITFSGLNCMDELLDYMVRLKGIIYFYNGSAFDGFFLIRPWMKNHIEKVEDLNFHHKDILSMKNNRIYQLTLRRKPKCVVKDLYLMFPMGTSLRQAAKCFAGDTAQKGDFDYSRIKSWDDIPACYDEVKEYCEQDVISLEGVFTGYNQLATDLFKLSIYEHLTLASLAYAVFCSLLETKNLLKTEKGNNYEMCRGALFGGRVSPQKPYFFSEDFNEELIDENGCMKEEDYEKINDYLQQWDEVSQYPNVMSKEVFPVGASNIITAPHILKHKLKEIENGTFDQNHFKRVIMEVDVTCPDDLITPFLFSRVDGKMKQDLLPKVKQLYTGVDIQEALELGYKITKIYRMLVFSGTDNIFKNFIEICFNGKKNSPKDGAAYQLYKYIMNSASGKFSQKLIETSSTLLSSKYILDQGGYHSSAQEVTLLKDNGDPFGVFVEYKKKDKEVQPLYPAHITAFITSYARKHISQIVRSVNGYKNPATAFYYTDTDSLILHKNVEEMIEQWKGKDLGQLDDELGGGKIIAAVFLAKKTYCVQYLKKVQQEGKTVVKLLHKVRCKGIPHTNNHLEKKDYEFDQDWKEKNMEIYSTKDGYVELKNRFYISHKYGKKKTISKHLDLDHYMSCLIGSRTVEVIYGGMDRKLRRKGDTSVSHKSLWLSRRLVGDDGHMWTKETRCWDAANQISYPIGHKNYKEEENEIPDNDGINRPADS
jgi:hypothetical protein